MKVGDEVVIDDVGRGARRAKVTRIGRKYIYTGGAYDRGYDIDTGRRDDSYGHTYMLTVEEYEYRKAVSEARSQLRIFGLDVALRMKPERVLETIKALEPLIAKWGDE